MKKKKNSEMDYFEEKFGILEVEHPKNPGTLLDIRDKIGHIKDLIQVCGEALIYSSLNDIKRLVVDTLYFQVQSQLNQVSEELKCHK